MTRLIEPAVASGLSCRWVAGDEAYGGDPQLAAALRAHRLGYVLAVACSRRAPPGLGIQRADQIAAGSPKRAWQRLSAGPGAKGFRYYDWAFITLPLADDIHGGHHWMLIRRSRVTGELAGASRNRSRQPRPAPARTSINTATGGPGIAGPP